MVLHWVMILTAVSELWLLRCLSGESICNRSNIGSINITTELRSDVLLPCYFEPVLLGSDMTADIVAVWIQENEAIPNLLEITLQGDVRSWNIKGGRIKTFSKLSVSGNFSILLHKVNQSDLGLYRCELFKGINCSIAYQDIGLHTVKGSHTQNALVQNWLFIAGGGAVALLVLVVSLCGLKRTCANASNRSLYENTGFQQSSPASKVSCGTTPFSAHDSGSLFSGQPGKQKNMELNERKGNSWFDASNRSLYENTGFQQSSPASKVSCGTTPFSAHDSGSLFSGQPGKQKNMELNERKGNSWFAKSESGIYTKKPEKNSSIYANNHVETAEIYANS
ncbi:uncharacterized protein LOC113589995 isoform X2 [Electrophorus electricus]|uniref:uncharacterized protein LOC113589995 isoform X2 n=1 Tax=Electrophorus electricus TaxID=8005 RepID=UPI0015D0943A|nr:uncharacterized protein LOC113589995 isoform X2 [Electrophorus electricus]